MKNLGHNNPPSEFDLHKEKIEGLFETAKGYVDGDPIASEAVAEMISDLDRSLMKAGSAAETQRKEENKPARAEIDANNSRYKALSSKVELGRSACREALRPWLQKKAEEKRAEEEKRRKELEEQRRKEAEALKNRKADDLESLEKFEQQVEERKIAEARLNRAQKDKPRAASRFGKAATLRKEYQVELTNVAQAMDYLWPGYEDRFLELAQKIAEEEVRKGKREIPGFKVIEKEVVR